MMIVGKAQVKDQQVKSGKRLPRVIRVLTREALEIQHHKLRPGRKFIPMAMTAPSGDDHVVPADCVFGGMRLLSALASLFCVRFYVVLNLFTDCPYRALNPAIVEAYTNDGAGILDHVERLGFTCNGALFTNAALSRRSTSASI